VFAFTAVIHSARSSGGKLLHSRRTDGFEHGGELFEVTDCMSRVTVARTRHTIRDMDIPRARDVPYGGGQGRETGKRAQPGSFICWSGFGPSQFFGIRKQPRLNQNRANSLAYIAAIRFSRTEGKLYNIAVSVQSHLRGGQMRSKI
jgi:hypothetical protein